MSGGHVLMLTGTWPPVIKAGTHRTLRLAHRLPQLGWTPTVLTPLITRNPYEGSMTLDFEVKVPENVEVLRPTVHMPRWRFHRRLAQMADLIGQMKNFRRVTSRVIWNPVFFPEWTSGAVKVAKQAHKNRPFDVVWVTGGPWGVFLTAKRIAKVLNLPLVLDYRDPWTASPDRQNAQGLKSRYQRTLERRCVEMAKGIAYVHPRCLDENERIFGRQHGAIWRTIYNGFEPIEEPLPPIGNDEPTIVHGGHCYASRSAVPILEALSELTTAEQPRTRFFGALDQSAITWMKENPLPAKFECNDVIPFAELRRHLMGASAQLLLVGAEHAHAVPSKIFDYMLTGRPVIGIGPENAEVRNIVEQCGIGVWCTPDDKSGIIEAFRKAKDGTLPYAPVADRIERFSADNMAIDTAKLLNDVCA